MTETEALGVLESHLEGSGFSLEDVKEDPESLDLFFQSCSSKFKEHEEFIEKTEDLAESICFLEFGKTFEEVFHSFRGRANLEPFRQEILEWEVEEVGTLPSLSSYLYQMFNEVEGFKEFGFCIDRFPHFREYVYHNSTPEMLKKHEILESQRSVIILHKYPQVFSKTHQFHKLWGDFTRNPMKQVKEDVISAGKLKGPVLIIGETGTGKELVADAIFQEWRQGPQFDVNPNPPYIDINAAGLQKDRITSDVFGHVKGAYTGADKDRKGFLELAEGGMLFIDEIGELSDDVQSPLLRFLENGSYYRMGADERRTSDVRIIAATNNPDGLREDIFARFRKRIYLPSLRERLHDMPIIMSVIASELRKKEGFSSYLSQEQILKSIEFSFDRLKGENVLSKNVRELESWVMKALEDNQNESGLDGLTAEEIIEVYKILGTKKALAEALETTRPTLDKRIKHFGIQALFEE